MLPHCNGTAGSHLCWKLAENSAGYTFVGRARSSCGKRSTSGLFTHLSKCAWAKSHYEAQVQRGKSRHAAIRSVAFKWLRIAFRCRKDGRKYDSELYQNRSSNRASVTAEFDVQWKRDVYRHLQFEVV
jgi:hypothetical protein